MLPFKGFHLVRDMPQCTTEFSKNVFLETFLLVVDFPDTILFQRIKTKKYYQTFKENTSLKTYFWCLKLIAYEHVGTRSHVGMWARYHVSTRARKTRWYVKHFGTWVHKHARHVGRWARKAHNLADPFKLYYL